MVAVATSAGIAIDGEKGVCVVGEAKGCEDRVGCIHELEIWE